MFILLFIMKEEGCVGLRKTSRYFCLQTQSVVKIKMIVCDYFIH